MAFRREATIKSAEKYVAKGKIEAAIREYRKVLKNNPTDVNTLNRVGDLYARIESFDEAVRLFTQIAEQYTRDGFFVKAIAIYKKIIKLDPSSLQVYEKLAALYAEQGLVTEARTQYQVLADYYQKHDNAASAITIYQRMAELEPDNPTFQLKLAELYASRRLVDRALESYARLADIFVVGGSIDEAAQVYLKALDLSAEDLQFVERAARSLRDAGNLSAAGRVLTKATELNPAAAAVGESIGLGDADDDPLATLEREQASAEEPERPSDAWRTTELEDIELEGLGEAARADEEPASEIEPFRLELDGIDELLDSGRQAEPPETPEPVEPLDAAELTGAAEPAESESLDGAEEPADDAGLAVDTDGLHLELEPETDPDEEVFVFELDLDDDEIPESLVRPPEDMDDDEEGTGWSDDAARTAARVAIDATDEEVVDLGDLDAMPGIDSIAAEDAGGDVAPPAEEAAPADEPDEPIEIDWSLDVLEEPAESEVVLDATAAPSEDPEDIEIEVIDLEPTDEAEAEDEAAEVALEADAGAIDLGELPTDLEDMLGDLGATQMVDPEALETAAEAADRRATDETSDDAAEEPSLAAEEIPAPAEAAAASDAAAVNEEAAASEGADSAISRSMRIRLAAVRHEEDLLAEAQVFAKYGLREKAEQRLRELWNLNPDNLEAAQLKTRLLLEDGDYGAVMAEANALAELSERVGDGAAWDTLRAQLVEVGFEVEAGRISAAPGKEAKHANRISQFLEVLDGATQEPPPAEETAPPEVVQEAELTGEIDSALDSFFASQTPTEGKDAQPSETPMSLAERLDLSELADSREVEVHLPPGALDQDVLDESGMSWLDETGNVMPETSATETPVFDEDDEFFDLAAEIERELDEEESQDERVPAGAPTEPSLEEIVEGFKRGVAEHLSPEDYDTHFNLGIAYREMGLLDEAIGEFQLASKDPRYLVDSSAMLGISFLEKGLPDLAIKWYRKGLEAPDIDESAMLGLLYDMAAAYEQDGNDEAAHKTWVEIYGINSTYRDVAKRIEASAPADG